MNPYREQSRHPKLTNPVELRDLPPEAKRGFVACECDSLKQAVEEMQEAVYALADTLKPVLSPTPQLKSPEGDNPEPVLPPLAEYIRSTRKQIETLTGLLRCLRKDCEL